MKRLRGLLGHSFRRTTLVAVFCGAVLAGLGLARVTGCSAPLILISCCLAGASLRRRGLAALLAVTLLGVCLGGWQGTGYMQKLSGYDGLYGKKVVFTGRAADDAAYGKKSQLAFDLTGVQVHTGAGDGKASTRVLPDEIGVSGFGANAILRGDVVQVSGKLRPGTGARQGWMSYAELRVASSHQGIIDTARRKFAAGMESALPEPEASFAMGLLVGQKTSLPPDVYQDLVMVGLVHIIAVSGYNLTIILRAAVKLLGKRSKYQTLVASLSLTITFLLITGASASIVRASIVSGLSLAAWYYGRAFKPLVLILLAAAATAWANPLYLWGDIGWYLSFLAFYGVLMLAPQVRARFLHGWWAESAVAGIALESLCAEAMTLPLVLYIFGQVSGVSLPANVLVAAFVPLAMLLSLVAGLAGMLLFPLAGWLAWPAGVLLTYMLDAAHLLASIPHVFRQNVYLSAIGMLAMYAVVLGVNLLIGSRLKAKRAIITPIFNELAGGRQLVPAPTK